MMRSWKALGWQSLLAVALAASSGPAQTTDEKAKLPQDKKDDVAAKVDGLAKSLNALDAYIREELGALRNDITTNQVGTQKTITDLGELKRQLAQLQKEVENLRNAASASRASLYPSPNQTGRIRLVNTFNQPQTIILNGQSYRLEPGQEAVVERQPAGNFTFEVLGVRAPVTRTLAANETYTIQVHP